MFEDHVLEVYRSELAEAEKEYAEATKQQADWAKRMQMTQASVNSLKHLLGVRQQKLQAEEAAVAAQEQLDGAEVTNTKTSFVLKMIESSPAGVTPAEIKQAGLAAGFDGSSNFPYTTLAKLKGAKRVREDAGKYFPG